MPQIPSSSKDAISTYFRPFVSARQPQKYEPRIIPNMGVAVNHPIKIDVRELRLLFIHVIIPYSQYDSSSKNEIDFLNKKVLILTNLYQQMSSENLKMR